MTEQFKEQGGIATMDPSPLRRWLLSKFVTYRSSERRLKKLRVKAEKRRRSESRPHVVEYFHQVDDGYSHLAAQMLKRFAERHDVELRFHLVPGPSGKNVLDSDLLLRLSRHDAALIAPQYGLSFPDSHEPPEQSLIELALSILASLDESAMGEHIADVSRALWSGDTATLEQLAANLGCVSTPDVAARVVAGDARQAELKHYSGAMFHYEGEWYWGVDRLHYLEDRLIELGLDKSEGQGLLAPCPSVDPGSHNDCSDLTLEFYPSVRSPYTAIVFDETVALAERTGVKFKIRPVLPMVMRGVPATLEKGMYIFFDTAREARRRGVHYGKFFDPIGDPVRRCYSIYPWAVEQGRGTELLSSFLRHTFAEGVNTSTDSGLRKVVESAGLNWRDAKSHIEDSGWDQMLEDNRLAMYEGGLWGVPSFRLLDASGQPLLEVWGQDRLWIVAQEIGRWAKRQCSDT